MNHHNGPSKLPGSASNPTLKMAWLKWFIISKTELENLSKSCPSRSRNSRLKAPEF